MSAGCFNPRSAKGSASRPAISASGERNSRGRGFIDFGSTLRKFWMSA
jgi:hypothetical protein